MGTLRARRLHSAEGRRRVPAALTALALALVGAAPVAVLVATPAQAADPPGSLILADDFTGTTADPEFVRLGAACLTSATVPSPTGSTALGACATSPVSGHAPGLTPDGGGYLQLTDALRNQTGAVLYNQPMPSSGGLDITFAQYQYGGGGTNGLRADGIGFFLTDGSTELTEAGGWGGSLGYAQSYDDGVHRDGVRGGYLGIGLDGFGNFVNDGFGKGAGCEQPAPVLAPNAYSDLVPDTVAIRGPGDGPTGYCFLTATMRRANDHGDPPAPPQGQTPSAGSGWTTTLPGELTAATLDAAVRYVHVQISPDAVHPVVTVDIDFDGPGSAGFVRVLSYTMPVPPPPTYKLGFAASTGANTNVHLIRTLQVRSVEELPQLNLVKQVDRSEDQPSHYGAGSTVPYEFVLTNTGTVPLTDPTVTDPIVTNVVCPDVTLAPAGQPGSSTVCRGTHVVTADEAATLAELTNTARAHATAGGATVDSNESTATVPLTLLPAIALSKSVTQITRSGAQVGEPVVVGDQITYGFVVRNAGNIALTGVALSDTRLTGLSCGSTTLAPGATTTCTAAPHTVTDADITADGPIVNDARVVGTATLPGGETDEVHADDTTTTATVTPGAHIAVVKTATLEGGGAVAGVGSTVTYSFRVVNAGTVTLHDVAVTDPRAGPVTCAVTTLAPGAETTCTADAPYEVTQADVDAGGVHNTATAHGTPPTGEAVSDTDDATVATPVADPGIELLKEATIVGGGAVADAGDDITYTFTVTNTGNVTLTGVGVTDPTLGTITCPSGPLAPADNVTCTGLGRVVTQDEVDAGSTLTNTATAHGAPPNGPDVTDVDHATVPLVQPHPSLVVEKAAGVASDVRPAAGATITYTYTVTNNGNVELTDLAVTDDKITGPIECGVTTLQPGDVTTCTAMYTVTQADVDGGGVTNQGTATGTTLEGDEVAASDTEEVETAPRVAGLTIVKSLAPDAVLPPGAGDRLTYDLQVTNTGNVTLSPVVVTDSLAGPVSCPQDALDPDEAMTCTASVTVTPGQVLAGEVNNTATAVGTPPQDSGLDPVTDTDDETVETVAPVAALVVDKQGDVPGADPGLVAVGDRVAYRYVVTNTGTLPLTDVRVHDDRVTGVDCPPGALDPGDQVTCTGEHVVTQAEVDAGHVENVATASGTDPGGDAVTSPEDREDLPAVPGDPALTIRKTATLHDADGDGLADVGEQVTYRYVVTSTGNVTVHAVRVVDDRVTVRCPSGALAPGDSLTCTATATVDQSDVDAAVVHNVATAHGRGPDGAAVTSPQDEASVRADARWELAVRKVGVLQADDGDGLAAAGDVVAFTTTATNTGSTTLTDVVVDDRDAGSTCTVPRLAPGESTRCTVRTVATASDVRAGHVRDRATALATNPFGYPVGGDASAQVATVPAPPPALAMTGADARRPGAAALAAVVLGGLLAWVGARLRVSPTRPRPVE